MAGTRRDIASLGGPWSETLLWYARAVAELQSRDFADRTSWRYLAAIHGADFQGWIDQGIIENTVTPPSQQEMRLMFNQCQHAGWFFLPWHRGYLAAFEEILADWIVAQGGPADWALPYWNYLDDGNASARDLPPEFLDPVIPGDNVPNPLATAARGPLTTLGPATWTNNADITLAAQTNNPVYTAIPGALGYGGPISGFNQQGNAFGAVESDPHNFVHVMIGGNTPGNPTGWMLDPDFAALDPVFWMHHCNIDRFWAAWMTDPNNAQDISSQWRNGPFPRQFAMPDAAGGLTVFTPNDTLPGQRLAPDYDTLNSGTGIAAAGGPILAANTTTGPATSSLVSANAEPLTVSQTAATTRLDLTAGAEALTAAGSGERLYLNVEGARGTQASGVVTVRVSAPDVTAAGFEQTIAFFGLAKASKTDGPHAGNGVSATIDITEKVQAMRLEAGASISTLEVTLVQTEGDVPDITVDRVSIYRLR